MVVEDALVPYKIVMTNAREWCSVIPYVCSS